jgi:uncharacterized membrane protein
MYTLISTFEYSSNLELAIGETLKIGIEKKDVFVIPLDQRAETVRMFDSIHKADGKSLVDLASIIGTIGMLLGVIYGFLLPWGPILWGVIGLITGLLMGFLIDYFILNRKSKRINTRKKQAEVLLLIVCPEYLMGRMESILWDNFALGVAKVKR